MTFKLPQSMGAGNNTCNNNSQKGWAGKEKSSQAQCFDKENFA